MLSILKKFQRQNCIAGMLTCPIQNRKEHTITSLETSMSMGEWLGLNLCMQQWKATWIFVLFKSVMAMSLCISM